MVDGDDVASTGFDLHGVADDLVLVVAAAEYDAWCALLDERNGAVFELSAAEALGMYVAHLFDLEGGLEGGGVLEPFSYQEDVFVMLEDDRIDVGAVPGFSWSGKYGYDGVSSMER